MKVFIGGLITETNTFSPLPTGRANYEETALFFGDATQHKARWASSALQCWRGLAEGRGMKVCEGLFAMAQPAGPTVEAVYEEFSGALVTGISEARPDMVLLSLHGAMVSNDHDDCEGDLLRRIRDEVGAGVTIGVELDPHCHLSDAIIEYADIVITYKEYPHTDVADIAIELFDLCARVHAGEVKPVATLFDCRMINIFRTTFEPMRSFVSKLRAAEREQEILAVSFVHGFPWGDVADAGAKFLIYSDNASEAAERLAQRLYDELWTIRNETGLPCVSLEDALNGATAARSGGDNRPAVFADVTDNPGGGAPGDNTDMLRAILQAGVDNVALSPLWDPQAVRICFEAGEGAQINLRVGGKCGPTSGDPLDLRVTVKGLLRQATQSLGGVSISMGDCAWVQVRGVDVVLNSIRTQTLGLDAFSALGVDPMSRDLLLVKSMNHFAAEFGPIAREVFYVSGDGALPVAFSAIPYRKFTGPYWPRVDNPFENQNAAQPYSKA